jgi:uncharacterized protein YijF (DUF1287 family)
MLKLIFSTLNKVIISITVLIIIGVTDPCFAFREGEPAGFSKKLSEAALERTNHTVRYDGAYRKISYPNGDVPDSVGVCTDVVIRSYRKLGIDLQKDVHEDMKAAFSKYPTKWGLKKPDKNIDHRRVPNLRKFFERNGIVLPVTKDPKDYLPGDLVTWVVPRGGGFFNFFRGKGTLPHIGIVVNKKSRDGKRFKIVHNIGLGPKLEDMLFEYEITGHYRYYGK